VRVINSGCQPLVTSTIQIENRKCFVFYRVDRQWVQKCRSNSLFCHHFSATKFSPFRKVAAAPDRGLCTSVTIRNPQCEVSFVIRQKTMAVVGATSMDPEWQSQLNCINQMYIAQLLEQVQGLLGSLQPQHLSQMPIINVKRPRSEATKVWCTCKPGLLSTCAMFAPGIHTSACRRLGRGPRSSVQSCKLLM